MLRGAGGRERLVESIWWQGRCCLITSANRRKNVWGQTLCYKGRRCVAGPTPIWKTTYRFDFLTWQPRLSNMSCHWGCVGTFSTCNSPPGGTIKKVYKATFVSSRPHTLHIKPRIGTVDCSCSVRPGVGIVCDSLLGQHRVAAQGSP